jgi:dTMP kinase
MAAQQQRNGQGNGHGFFLTIEGIDGTGKSTQARMLAARVRAAGREVVETREPGGAPGAEEIRRLLVEGDPERWSPQTETLLFTAARRDHVERVIRPALDRGAVVICDRYVDSTRAYQGIGAPERRHLVDRLHDLAIGLDPDLTVILDMDPAAALRRAGDRLAARHEDRFEKKGAAFQTRLRAGFRAIAEAEPGRCVLIDAADPPEAVAVAVWDAVAPRLGASS